MSVPDQEKFGAKLSTRLDTISAIPIKKRRFFFSRSPSPPPETQSSLTVDCGTTQDKSFSLVQVPSLEASDFPVCLTASSKEGSSRESEFKILVNGDISEAPNHEDPIEHGSNENLQSMTSIIVEEQNGLKVTVSDDKFVSLKGIEQPSTPIVGHFDVPIKKENFDGKNISSQTSTSQFSGNTELQCKETFEKVNISEPDSIRRAQFELQDTNSRKETSVHDSLMKFSTFGPNTDSSQSCFDRLNWDLNTPMDTWEESMNEYPLNHEGDGHHRSGFGGLLGRAPQLNLICAIATNKKPNASPPMIVEPKSLSGDHSPRLCTLSESGAVCDNSESEASLDLRLKPSFISESYFTCGTPLALGNVDSLKETQFLSSSTMSLSSSADAKFSVCGAVKSEPLHGCIKHGEMKTEIAESEAFGLISVKFEPCELGETSKLTISGADNSASDAAIKQEPVEDKSQDCVIAKEIVSSHMSSDDHNLLQSAKAPLVAVGNGFMASITKSDSFIKDVIMQIPAEVDGMAHIMQNGILSNDKICHMTMPTTASTSQSEKGIFCEPKSLDLKPLVNEGRELISTKQTSNESSEHADLFIKCQIEGQIMNLVSEECEQPHMAEESQCILFNSGLSVEMVVDEMAEIESRTSLSETDSKTETVVEKYGDYDVLEFNQATTKSICVIEEQGDNECKTGSPHVIDVVVRAVHEKGVIDDLGFEVDEVKDGASLCANVDSFLRVELTKLSSSHELVKHTIFENTEMSKEPGSVECANKIDPATTADLQESSSVTADSNRMKRSKIIRKTSQDVLKKDKVSVQKSKFDEDSTLGIVSIENKAEGSGLMESARGSAKSSVSLSASEVIKDAFDSSCTGRIINLNSASSGSMKPTQEIPLSSSLWRENPSDKLFNGEKSHSRHSRDENPSEQSRKTEIEKRRGLAFGNHGSDYLHLRFRDKKRPNQFGNRNCDPNYMREQINDHNDFRYSRDINLDASASRADRIPRKVANEFRSHAYMARRMRSPGGSEQSRIMRPRANEVNSSRCLQRNANDLVYVSQEKMSRPEPGELLDPLEARRHSQFEQTDRIAARRERQRAPSQLTPPLCSPRSQAMSPPHWSSRSASDSEGFNEQPEMVQCRTGAPNIMQESMRSTPQHYAEEIFARRRGSAYGARVHDAMMEVASSREHDFPRPGRGFHRKFPRLHMNHPSRASGEYHRAPFGRVQIGDLPADGDYSIGRRCNEVHAPARYRQHSLAGDDVENFSFHGEEGPLRSYRYDAEGNQGFHEGGNSREFDGRFKHRFGNTSRRYRHREEEQQHEDGFRHPEGQGWNDSGFNNIRPKRRRY